MDTTTSQTQEEIKEAIEELENIKNKEKYTVELIYDREKDKYSIIVYNSMNKEIYEKELNKQDNNMLRDLEEIYIKNYEDKIKNILEKLRKNKILIDYDLSIIIDSKKILKYTLEYVQANIMLYLDEEILKEIEKDEELKKYILHEGDNYLYLRLKPILYSKSFEFLDVQANIYYVCKEIAEDIIKNFSK